MNAQTLKKVLSEATKACKSPVPTMNDVKFEFGWNALRITSSSPELTVRYTLTGGLFLDSGTFLIDPKKLVAIIGKGKNIDFTSDNNVLSALVDNVNYSLQSEYSVDDYKEFHEIEDTRFFSPIDTKELDKAMAICAYAMGDSNRFNLDTMNVDVLTNNCWYYVSTDGHRMETYSTSPVNIHQETVHKNFMLPGNAVNFIVKSKLFKRPTTELSETNNLFMFHNAEHGITRELFCRKPQGEYPNFRRVIPDMEPKSAHIANTKELASAINALIPLTDKRDRAINISANGSIELSRKGTSISVHCHNSNGESDFIINAQFLQDMLSKWDSNNITLQAHNGSRNVFLHEDNQRMSLIMGMRK